MTGQKPHFLIIGAQKCGTTSLYDYLCRHPMVSAASEKEVHFFDLHYSRGLDWYTSQFPPPVPGVRTGEASPYYLFHPLVPSRVAEVLPGARLLVLLRDPAERAYSQYQHERRLGQETLDLPAALLAEGARLEGVAGQFEASADFSSASHQHHSYVSRGLYLEQLLRWRRFFPAAQMLVLFAEEVWQGAEALKAVWPFLGLPPVELGSMPRLNAGRYEPLPPAVRDGLKRVFLGPDAQLAGYLGRPLPWSP